jgi:hypothetical protein
MEKINVDQEFSYFKSGNFPKLLIHSGTHGDEYEVIELVEKAVKKYERSLPPFFYVPRVSPSAVKNKTRENEFGKDINRVFFSNSQDPDVIQNIKVMNNHRFKLIVSFHEDPEFEQYYIYDSGYGKSETKLIKEHNNYLQNNNISLLNGMDDPSDPDLGYLFKNGYKRFEIKNGESENGMIIVWTLVNKISRQCLIPEIPGKLNIGKKDFIVDSFFAIFLVPYFIRIK